MKSTYPDPLGTLVLLLMTVATALLGAKLAQVHLTMAAVLAYLLCFGLSARALRYTLIYALVFGLLLLLTARAGSALVVLYLCLRMLPVVTISAVFLVIPPSLILIACTRLRLPAPCTWMVVTLLRFTALLGPEMTGIRDGIRARGVLSDARALIKEPLAVYDCLALPLITRGLKLSEELTAAAGFRGLTNTADRRTSIYAADLSLRQALPVVLAILAEASILLLGALL